MNEFEMKTLNELLNEKIQRCNKCNGSRQRLSFDNLTPEQKITWAKFIRDVGEDLFKIDYFLYCKKCKEYSVINEVVTDLGLYLDERQEWK